MKCPSSRLSLKVAEFRDEDHYFVRFPYALFVNTRFVDCSLRKAIFRRATFVGCVFENCRLGQSVFVNASFQDTQFVGTDLKHAVNMEGVKELEW